LLAWCAFFYDDGGTARALILSPLQMANASVSIDVDSQHGLFDWTLTRQHCPVFGGGINDYRQWFGIAW